MVCDIFKQTQINESLCFHFPLQLVFLSFAKAFCQSTIAIVPWQAKLCGLATGVVTQFGNMSPTHTNAKHH